LLYDEFGIGLQKHLPRAEADGFFQPRDDGAVFRLVIGGGRKTPAYRGDGAAGLVFQNDPYRRGAGVPPGGAVGIDGYFIYILLFCFS